MYISSGGTDVWLPSCGALIDLHGPLCQISISCPTEYMHVDRKQAHRKHEGINLFPSMSSHLAQLEWWVESKGWVTCLACSKQIRLLGAGLNIAPHLLKHPFTYKNNREVSLFY